MIFNFISSKKIRIWGFKKQTYVAEIIQTIQQSFGSIKQIILRGNQKFFLKNFNKTLFDLNEQSRKLMFISEIPKNILESLIVLIICFILLLSSFDSENLIDLAPLVGLYFAAALRITPAINRIIASKQAIDSCYPAVKLVNEELSNENILSKPSNFIDKKNYDFEKEINLENITFKYPKSKHPVFKNLNLKIKKNDCICFIGKSGSGKTTLIDLISGLLNPNIGKITLDGREVSLTSDEWKKSIGYVTQSNYLIDDTIKENILFGQNEYSKFDEEKFEKAVKNSQLDVFVNQLSEGINYKVGENGIKLSGGQRQRISIARTLYLNPKILILDEITNSLDKETSASLLDCLNELSGKITIIYITHDDQVIDKANTVYKIEKNKNEESSNLFEIKKR